VNVNTVREVENRTFTKLENRPTYYCEEKKEARLDGTSEIEINN